MKKKKVEDTPWSGKGAFAFEGGIWKWNADFMALGDTCVVHFNANGGFSLKAVGVIACDLDGFWLVDPMEIPVNKTNHCACKFTAVFGAFEEGYVALTISAKLKDGNWHKIGVFTGEGGGAAYGDKDSHGTLHIMNVDCTTVK